MKKILSVLFTLVMIISSASLVPAQTESSTNGFEKTVSEFAKGIRVGWNLGNTLDSYYDNPLNPPPAQPQPDTVEKLWANPKTTQAMIAMVKNNGFNAIRIPVTWLEFTGPAPNYTIDSAWMNRVQQVVDYAMDLGMYTIINVHHDTARNSRAWLTTNPTNKAVNIARLSKIWTQIANRFKNYPEKLIFEGMNEVFNMGNPSYTATAADVSVVKEFNQTFVNAVRATGGNNELRYLMCPTYGAQAEEPTFPGFELPDDDRLMLSLHIYYNTWESENSMAKLERRLEQIKLGYIEQGIPVIIGEWGSTGGTTQNPHSAADRIDHADRYMTLANQYGVKCFWWDDGGAFKILDRGTLEPTQTGSGIVNAIMQALEKPFVDPFDYLLKWSAALNANWQACNPTYHEDGSMTVLWPGIAGQSGKQNQYASKLKHEIANFIIRRAKAENRTLEFTIKLLQAKAQNGTSLQSMQVLLNPFSLGSSAVWVNVGEEKKITIDVSNFNTTFTADSVVQLLVQNYQVTAAYDVKVWISPIKISPPTNTYTLHIDGPGWVDAYFEDNPVEVSAYAVNSQGNVVTAPELVSIVYVGENGVSNSTGVFTVSELEMVPNGDIYTITVIATFLNGTTISEELEIEVPFITQTNRR